MPLYEFKCKKCGKYYDFLMGADAVPACGEELDNPDKPPKNAKCKCVVLVRVPSAHGRMASWSNW